jgi:hypothetical protein
MIVAHLGTDQYSAVVDAKTARKGKINDAAINWLALDTHRKQQEATYAMVVGTGFAGGNLTRWSDQYKVALLPTASLVDVLRLHRATPFSLYDLRPLFATPGQSSYAIEQLRKVHQATKTHWELLMQVVTHVDEVNRALPGGMPVHAENLHYMLIGQRGAANAPSVAELQEALAFLASRAVGVLRPQEGGGYTLAMTTPTAQAQLRALVGALAPQPERPTSPEVVALSEPVAPAAPRLLRPLAPTVNPTAKRGAIRDAVLARLRERGLSVEPLPDVRGCWRVGKAVWYVRSASAMVKSGKTYFWYDLRREALDGAARHGSVRIVFALGGAEHLLVVPVEAIRDLLSTGSGTDRDRWLLEVRGTPGVEPLQLYVPPRQYRDASGWYNAIDPLR